MDFIYKTFGVLLALVLLCTIIAIHWHSTGWKSIQITNDSPFLNAATTAPNSCQKNDLRLIQGLCTRNCNNDYDCGVGNDKYPVPNSCLLRQHPPMSLLPNPDSTEPSVAGTCSMIDGVKVSGVCKPDHIQIGPYCLKMCNSDGDNCSNGTTCMAFGGITDGIQNNGGICIGKSDASTWQSLVGKSKNVSNVVFKDCTFTVTINSTNLKKTFTKDVTSVLNGMVSSLNNKAPQQGTGFFSNLFTTPLTQNPVTSLYLTLPLNPFSFALDDNDANALNTWFNTIDSDYSGISVSLTGKYKDFNI